MILIPDFKGHEFGVFGLGAVGLSAARALKASGAVPYVWDDRPEKCDEARKEGFVTVNLLETDWTRFLALIVGPGVPLDHPVAEKAKALNIPIIGDLELFARALGDKDRRAARVIAVTGTNGKSITTSLIGHILSRAGFDVRIGGNIVKPVLDLDPPSSETIYVLEVSSFQLETTYTLAPDVAVLLNLSPDHLDRHGDMDAYCAVKARIFEGQGRGDQAVIGVDDDHCAALCEYLKAGSGEVGRSVTPISTTDPMPGGLFVKDGYLYDTGGASDEPIADLMDVITLPGKHNWQNAAAAFAAVRRILGDPEKIMAGIKSFPGVAHRMEIVATVDTVWFINDSKCTNADAAARALDCYEEVYWIAGGRAKDNDWSALEEFLPRVRKAYLIGESGPTMAESFSGKVETAVLKSLDQAVAAAYADAIANGQESSVVLFSPACTSFDQFPDFESRGEAFRMVVRALETARMRAGTKAPEGRP